jgi:tetratricopeptide (TPR) repeat protein
MDPNQLEMLIDSGLDHMKKREWNLALKCFHDALPHAKDPSVRNNLAVTHFFQKNYPEALEILQPNLVSSVMNPYARALASQAFYFLGEFAKAETMLKQAIIQLDWSINNRESLDKKFILEGLFEYTVIVKRAAGLLGKDQLVLDLHTRWEKYYQTPEDQYLTGVAYFNLKHYRQAVTAWEKIIKTSFRFLEGHLRVVPLIESGLIPEFTHEYMIPVFLELKPETAGILENTVHLGSTKMFLLDLVLHNLRGNEEASIHGLGLLIKYGGTWGINLGQSFLESNTVSTECKIGVAKELVAAGIYREKEKIPALIDGKEQFIVISPVQLAPESSEVQSVFQEALGFAKNNQCQKAIELLESLNLKKGFYPPATELLAKIYYNNGDSGKALQLCDMLLELERNNSEVLRLSALAHYKLGRADEALAVLKKINLKDVSWETAGEIKEMIVHLSSLYLTPNILMEQSSQDLVEEARSKTLPKTITLANCLKLLPVEWLNAIATLHQLPAVRQRRDRENLIARYLLEGPGLSNVIKRLSPEAATMLEYIMEEKGAAKLAVIHRNFGKMEDIFWWDEVPPVTPLGQLCHRGLVFVGTGVIKERHYKLAVIPGDLLRRMVECKVGV